MCVWDGSSHAPADLSNRTCRRISTSAMISIPDNCCCIVVFHPRTCAQSSRQFLSPSHIQLVPCLPLHVPLQCRSPYCCQRCHCSFPKWVASENQLDILHCLLRGVPTVHEQPARPTLFSCFRVPAKDRGSYQCVAGEDFKGLDSPSVLGDWTGRARGPTVVCVSLHLPSRTSVRLHHPCFPVDC